MTDRERAARLLRTSYANGLRSGNTADAWLAVATAAIALVGHAVEVGGTSPSEAVGAVGGALHDVADQLRAEAAPEPPRPVLAPRGGPPPPDRRQRDRPRLPP